MKNRLYNKILNAVIVTITVVSISSCYEDKGNYNYTDVGSIVVEYKKTSSMHSVMMNNEIEINPDIITTGFNEENFDYCWDISIETVKNPEMKVLSRSKVFKEVVREPANKYDLRLTITDRKTGIQAYGMYKLTVLSYTTRCFLLACKAPNGEYDISAAPISDTRGEVGQNLFSMANDGKTIKDLTNIVYLNNISSEQFLYVCQKDGGCTLSPIDLTYFGDHKSWFFETPEIVKPTTILGDADGKDYFILSDGGVYYIDNNLKPPFKARLREAMPDGTQYYCRTAARVRNRTKALGYGFWDELNHRFLTWEKSKKKLATIDAVQGVFDPNAIPKNQTPIYLGDGSENLSYSIFKDENNALHFYIFKNTSTSTSTVTFIPFQYKKVTTTYGIEKSTTICPSRKIDVIYYAIDNVIYCFDPVSNKNFEFYRDEDTNMRFGELYSIDKYDGNIYAYANSGDKGYFYRIYANAAGELASPSETRPIPWDKVGPYANITEMEYLLKDY